VDTQVNANAVGLLAGAGGTATNTVTSTVTTQLYGTVIAFAIAGHAENDFSHPSLGDDVDNFGANTDGLISGAGGTTPPRSTSPPSSMSVRRPCSMSFCRPPI